MSKKRERKAKKGKPKAATIGSAPPPGQGGLGSAWSGGPLDAREVSDVVEATVRAACRLVRELAVQAELGKTVCRSALEAVRGQSGATARWLPDVTSAQLPSSWTSWRANAPRTQRGWIACRLSWW